MNKMAMYTKVITVRDRQCVENKRLEEEYVAEQRKLDMMMEIDRLKGLKRAADQEDSARAAAKLH